jgi:hypothetical protein
MPRGADHRRRLSGVAPTLPRLSALALTLAIVLLAALAPSAQADITEVNPPLQKIAEEQATKLAGYLGFPLTLHLAVGYGSDQGAVENVDTTTLDKENGHFAVNGPVCQITANRGWLDAHTHYEVEEVLVHEDFHCYEHQIAPNAWRTIHHTLKEEAHRGILEGKLGDEGEREEADWIIEGLARWVDLTLYPATGKGGLKNLTEYYATPQKSLFDRSYDAVGFWAHLQDISGGDLWHRIPNIIRAGVNFANQQAADAALGGQEETFLSSWGSSAFDLPSSERPIWLMESPLGSRYWPEGAPSPAPQKVDGSDGVTLAPYTTAQLEIQPRADEPFIRIHFDPNSYGRFGVTQNYSGHELEEKTFCAPEACKSPKAECPSGDTSKIPPLTPLPDQPYLGVAAGRFSSTVQITYSSPQGSGECEPPPPTSGSPEAGTTASSFGDPHLNAFGGFGFEFQDAGEFTLLKSTGRHDLEIQVRQQPELSQYFAVDTAVAMRVGKAIVEVDRPVSSLGPPTVLIDHRPTHAGHLELRGGGSFERIDLGIAGEGGLDTSSHAHKLPGVRVRWPDGTYVEVPENAIGISLLLKVAPDRRGHLTGLIGDPGVPALDEFHGREGRPYSPSLLEGNTAALDRKYGGSWRIKQRESLFTYARHKNTRSYTILNFPKKLFNLGTVPLAKALHTEALCRKAGATNLRLLQDCEYDVLVSGNEHYAEADGIVQTVSEPGPPESTPPATPSPVFATPAPTAPPSEVTPGPSAPSPPPAIDLGAGEEQPSVAYDPSLGYTYAAWQDPLSDDTIDLCVVPSGATTCNGGDGPYKLTDPLASEKASPRFFGSKVLVMPGGTVVVVANIDGASEKVKSNGYESAGEIAWKSPAGGAEFGKAGQGIANGGKLLAEAHGEMPNQGAIALGTSNILTYGNEHPFGSGATDFTLTGPALKTTPLVDLAEEFGDNGPVSQLAAEEYPAKSKEYLVVTAGNDAYTPQGCPSGSEEGTGYGVAKGTTTKLQEQSAWKNDFKAIACSAGEVVLAGGGPGHAAIGAVDSEGPGLNGGGEDGLYFRPFSTSSDTFGGPSLISPEGSYTLDGADELSASEDSAGGLDAAWFDGRGVMLAHSSDGGSSWQTPSITGIEGGDIVVVGTSPGEASIAYTANPSGDESQEYLAPSL